MMWKRNRLVSIIRIYSDDACATAGNSASGIYAFHTVRPNLIMRQCTTFAYSYSSIRFDWLTTNTILYNIVFSVVCLENDGGAVERKILGITRLRHHATQEQYNMANTGATYAHYQRVYSPAALLYSLSLWSYLEQVLSTPTSNAIQLTRVPD